MKTYELSEDVSSPINWNWNCGRSRLRLRSVGRQKDKAWLHGGNRNKFLYLSLYFISMSSSLARIFVFFYKTTELIAKSISCKQPLNSKFIGCIWIFYKVSRKSSLHIEGWSLVIWKVIHLTFYDLLFFQMSKTILLIEKYSPVISADSSYVSSWLQIRPV